MSLNPETSREVAQTPDAARQINVAGAVHGNPDLAQQFASQLDANLNAVTQPENSIDRVQIAQSAGSGVLIRGDGVPSGIHVGPGAYIRGDVINIGPSAVSIGKVQRPPTGGLNDSPDSGRNSQGARNMLNAARAMRDRR